MPKKKRKVGLLGFFNNHSVAKPEKFEGVKFSRKVSLQVYREKH